MGCNAKTLIANLLHQDQHLRPREIRPSCSLFNTHLICQIPTRHVLPIDLFVDDVAFLIEVKALVRWHRYGLSGAVIAVEEFDCVASGDYPGTLVVEQILRCPFQERGVVAMSFQSDTCG
jgi:hypothetical protein